LAINAYGSALEIAQIEDFSAANYGAIDSVDIFHQSTGDGVFVNHGGGEPPGYSNTAGDDAAFNVIIPYYIDNPGDGRDGSVVNDRTGMVGLRIQAQALGSAAAISLENFGAGPAIQIDNQSTEHPNVGTVDGITLAHWGTGNGLLVVANATPASQKAAIKAASGVATVAALLRLEDSAGRGRFQVWNNGSTSIGVPDPTVTMNAAAVLQVEKDAAGVQETLFLQNYGNALTNAAGDGVRIDFMENCKIEAVVDSVSTWHSSLRLFAATGYATPVERLRLDGTGIGFFTMAATPAAQQTGGAATAGGTYTATEKGMINAMYTALRAYGLLT